MIVKLNIDNNWKEKYKTQSDKIIDWIGKDAPLEEKYKADDKDDLFDVYLRGTDIAGIGQGRFSNNAKGKVKEAWQQVAK